MSLAVAAGSGLSALTLWVATVRLPPLPALSVICPPKRLTQAKTGSTSATSAVAERRSTATTSSTGMPSPSHGRKVSSRLPKFPTALGI